MSGQHLEELPDEAHLQGLPATLDYSEMKRSIVGRHQTRRSGIVASKPAHREEFVRQDSQCHVGVVQSCLQVGAVTRKRKRNMSAEARKRIGDAQRKRWAKQKAQK